MKVSIIIPVYNVVNYIGNCLNSVQKQNYQNIEVVVVDDCTPDNSMEVAIPYINKLREKFDVVIVKHETNKGLSSARNSGVKASSGALLYFLDSDDEISPDSISLLVHKIIKFPDSDFVIGGIKVINGELDQDYPVNILEYINSNTDIVDSYLSFKWYAMAWNKLIKKDFFINNSLWFEDGLIHEDELFSYKLAFSAQSMSVVYEKTYLYKIRHAESITTQRKQKSYNDLLYVYNYVFSNANNRKSDTTIDHSLYIYIHIITYISSVLNNNILTYTDKCYFVESAQLLLRKNFKLVYSLPYFDKFRLYLLMSLKNSMIIRIHKVRNIFK